VTKLAQVEGRWTFALAEMMVMDGNLNIALGAKVEHQGGTGLPPRWLLANLTDGRTPLGPPIDRSSVPDFDALFASMHPDQPNPWMSVDLGREMLLDEVRLHPLHARQGADVPGFSFPARFRVELSKNSDFSDAVTHFSKSGLRLSEPRQQSSDDPSQPGVGEAGACGHARSSTGRPLLVCFIRA
jgi:hypothetical protein